MLHEVGAQVRAVIFDGASRNVGMAEKTLVGHKKS